MTDATPLIETVPNYSEGRDPQKIEKIVDAFRGRPGVKLLDYQADHDHNRMVATVVGEPDPLRQAVLDSVATAIDTIDLRRHQGEHPRMGAVDVIPFIPLRAMDMDGAVAYAKQVAQAAAERFKLPVFLYEAAACRPERQNLATVRKGQFENMAAKIAQPEWQPDFGPNQIHPSAGVTAVGARMPLVAYNINLNTADLTVADAIARKVRHIGGGLHYCKAIGVELKDRGMVQVSMNLTDYTRTAIYRAFELVRIEARRYGVTVAGSEVVGLVPMAALVDSAAYYLGLENFSLEQVLETHLMQ